MTGSTEDPARPERDSLFEFRRLGPFAPWTQVAAVVALFVATVLCTHAEYRAKGTVFGYPGPGFNALVAPIYEELVFRGWILGRLARAHSRAFAIWTSGILFGVLHLRNIYWLDAWPLARLMIYAGLVLGPLLAWVTLKCRSVWPAVCLHYLNNLAWYL